VVTLPLAVIFPRLRKNYSLNGHKDAGLIGFVLSSIREMPFNDGEFDVCFCMDALEHLIVYDIFASSQRDLLESVDLG